MIYFPGLRRLAERRRQDGEAEEASGQVRHARFPAGRRRHVRVRQGRKGEARHPLRRQVHRTRPRARQGHGEHIGAGHIGRSFPSPRLLFISSSLPSSVRQAARFLAKGRHSRRHSGGQHRRSGKSPSISISNAIGWLAQKRRIKKLCMLVEVDRESRLSAANSCQVGFPTNGKRIYEIEGDLALLPSLSSHLRPPAIDHSTLHLFSPA